eukprot:TRINITY_DN19536_c0_g1_i2.p1 TRINITY_DN19536_c0_g1~~TRINITY_DN19536_c0_g1_i2.p1  ORF type:complete len:345 (+),score=66.82 TRINITY_DN19536_c0_g1_i2:158-1192(+)
MCIRDRSHPPPGLRLDAERTNTSSHRKPKRSFTGESTSKFYVCEQCQLECPNAKAYKSHLKGRKHKLAQTQPGAGWRGDRRQFMSFPCRESTLCEHAMVAELDATQAALLASYLHHRFTDRSQEMVECLRTIAERHPKRLRVKELFETVEAWHVVCSWIQTCIAQRKEHGLPSLDTVYDAACGHGLMGVLLAYRFPQLQVVCVDKKERAAFNSYVEVVDEMGECSGGHDRVLCNLRHIEGDLTQMEYTQGSVIVCIHGCHEATKAVLDISRVHRTAWAVMPCCVRDGLYGPTQRIRTKEDDVRHAFICGLIAAQYSAIKSTAIDRSITNRHIVVLGDCLMPDDH